MTLAMPMGTGVHTEVDDAIEQPVKLRYTWLAGAGLIIGIILRLPLCYCAHTAAMAMGFAYICALGITGCRVDLDPACGLGL